MAKYNAYLCLEPTDIEDENSSDTKVDAIEDEPHDDQAVDPKYIIFQNLDLLKAMLTEPEIVQRIQGVNNKYCTSY